MARRHHYLVAHRRLPHVPDAILRTLLASPDPTAALLRVWNTSGEDLAEEDRMPADGLAAKAVGLRKHDVLLVAMPKPTEPAEAFFTALVLARGRAATRGYFTLEHSISPINPEPYTVFCEWTINPDRHVNLGPGPAANAKQFLRAIANMVEPRWFRRRPKLYAITNASAIEAEARRG